VQFGCFVMVASGLVAETTTPKMKAKSNQGHGALSIRDNSESVPRYAGWLSIALDRETRRTTKRLRVVE